MSYEELIRDSIDRYKTGIEFLYADISMTSNAQAEEKMWEAVSDHEKKILELEEQLADKAILYKYLEDEGITSERIVIVDTIYSEFKKTVRRNPKLLYDLDSRKFEEFVANLLRDFGYECQLTPPTRDGGCDIYARIHTLPSSFLLYVECKKYKPENKVGIDVVQRVFGAANADKANKSMIVTTSFFTRDAIREHRKISSYMDLADYDILSDWLHKVHQ